MEEIKQELTAPAAVPEQLTDEQRDTIRAFFDATPDGGYKRACREAGIVQIGKVEAKRLIESDPELADYRLKGMGLDEDSLFLKLGGIAGDDDHRDQLRAITFGLAAVHGYGAKVEHVVEGGPVEVVVEHDYGRLFDKLEQIGLIRRGAGAAAEPAGQRLLPPPAE